MADQSSSTAISVSLSFLSNIATVACMSADVFSDPLKLSRIGIRLGFIYPVSFQSPGFFRMSGLCHLSSFLDALSFEIQKKLQRALNLPSQRPKILHELFKDLALEVDDRAKAKLQADITSSTEGDLISPADYDLKDQLCFYDVLADIFLFADHSLWVPECGKPILHLIVQLWSQSFASHIFSLLFHKWLLEVQVDHSEDLLQYSSALVQGATNIFWYCINATLSRKM